MEFSLKFFLVLSSDVLYMQRSVAAGILSFACVVILTFAVWLCISFTLSDASASSWYSVIVIVRLVFERRMPNGSYAYARTG